jgi:hypothetical protein
MVTLKIEYYFNNEVHESIFTEVIDFQYNRDNDTVTVKTRNHFFIVTDVITVQATKE